MAEISLETRYRLRSLATQMIAILDDPPPFGPLGKPADPLNPDSLHARAKQIYDDRRKRENLFEKDLFADPAWDMLLDLYIAQKEDRTVSVTSACIGANVPTSTGLRWISLMEDRGFLVRESDQTDNRRTNVRLSEKARRKLDTFLGQSRRFGGLPGPGSTLSPIEPLTDEEFVRQGTIKF